MNSRIAILIAALVVLVSLVSADVITFTNGATIRGTFLGGDSRNIRIEVNSKVEVYRISEVASIQFGDGPLAGGQSAGAGSPVLQAAAAQAATQAVAGQAPTVPQAPAVPSAQVPQIQAPQIQAPQVQAPQAPQVQAPSAPKVKAPETPKRGLFGRKKKADSDSEEPAAAAEAPPAAPAPAQPPPPVQPSPVPPPPAQAVAAQTPGAPPPAAQPAAAVPAASAAQAAPAAAPPEPVPEPSATQPAPAAAQAPPAAPPAQTVTIGGTDGRTIPAGALLHVRMIDSIDSTVHQPGETFRASLEADLSAMGAALLSQGSDVMVRLVQVPASSAEMRPLFRLEAISVRVNGRNLAMAAQSLPAPSAGVAGEAGLARLDIASDSVAIFRVTRDFRVP